MGRIELKLQLKHSGKASVTQPNPVVDMTNHHHDATCANRLDDEICRRQERSRTRLPREDS